MTVLLSHQPFQVQAHPVILDPALPNMPSHLPRLLPAMILSILTKTPIGVLPIVMVSIIHLPDLLLPLVVVIRGLLKVPIGTSILSTIQIKLILI
jgi:hypothetical protein